MRLKRNVSRVVGPLLAVGALLGGASWVRADQNAKAPPSQPIELYARPPAADVAIPAEISEPVFDTPGVRDISRPTLTPVLPAPGRANGASVIVLPGGGYRYLAIDAEGFRVAHYLADHGVTAFVLKYRVKPTPVDRAAFMQQIMADLKAAGTQSAYVVYGYPAAIEDGQAAVRLVRAHAAQWGLDSRRIGMLGFSAGAITALKVATTGDAASRPDFAASIYGPLEPIPTPGDAPPLFIASATDDGIFGNKGYGLLDAWRASHRPFEFHIYERGGHGFSLGRPHTTTADWPEAFLSWLRMRDIVPAS